MTAERYLQSIRDMRDKIKTLEEARDRISAPINVKAISYDRIRIQTSPSGDELENDVIRAVSKIEKMDQKIKKITERYEILKTEATDHILLVPEGQSRRFLLDYYIIGKSIREIESANMFEGEKSVYNLKKRAIRKFERVYKR